MLQCYNRGCGQLFDPATNNDGKCYSKTMNHFVFTAHCYFAQNLAGIIPVHRFSTMPTKDGLAAAKSQSTLQSF